MLVDRGSSLAAELMQENLQEVEAQLCPFSTEASCGVGLNKRSHRYLQKSIKLILLQGKYSTGQDPEDLLGNFEAD